MNDASYIELAQVVDVLRWLLAEARWISGEMRYRNRYDAQGTFPWEDTDA